MAAKKSTVSKETPAKKEPAARDKFGCRMGSQAASINAALTSKPRTVAQIAEAAGVAEARVRSHCKFLLGKKLIAETDDGYKCKPAK